MRNKNDWSGNLQKCAFLAVVFIFMLAAILLNLGRLAHGAIIDPHLTSPAYITVSAEKGDTAYSIAKLFTPRGQSAMPAAMDFVAFNNLSYNKKGNPVVHARRLYAFPTKMSRDKMRATVLSLNTAPRDWHSEHYNNHPYILEMKKRVAEAEQAVARTETTDENLLGLIDAVLSSAPLAFVIFSFVIFLSALVQITATRDYRKHVAKLDILNEPPDQEKGETNGAKESRALPPEYRDPKDPYEDKDALTGIRPEQQMLNLIWKRPVEEVAALLDFDTIPIAVGRPGEKYGVKWIKFGNLRRSLEMHPVWRGTGLYDLITKQRTAVALQVRAEDEVAPSPQ